MERNCGLSAIDLAVGDGDRVCAVAGVGAAAWEGGSRKAKESLGGSKRSDMGDVADEGEGY